MCPLATANVLGHNHLSGPVPPWDVHLTGREEAHGTIFGRAEGTVAQRLLPGDVGNMRNDACQPMKGSLLRLGLSNSNNVCVWILIITYYNFIFNDL